MPAPTRGRPPPPPTKEADEDAATLDDTVTKALIPGLGEVLPSVTVDVQIEGAERTLTLAEFEARVREGSLGGEVPVRIAAITGDRWVAACTLQLWISIEESPEARFQRSWARPATPWMTALVVGASVRTFLWLYGTAPGAKVGDAWALATAPTVELGQSWRLYTYGFLHGGPAHLLMNMLFLVFIGVALETLLGSESIAALYLFSVVGGGSLSAWLSPETATVGASAGDFGFLFAAIVIGWRYIDLLPRSARSAFGVSVLVFSIYGFAGGLLSDEVDNWGHFGGVLCGLVFGTLVRPIATPGGRARNRLVSLTVVAIVIIWLGAVHQLGLVWLPYTAETEDGVSSEHPSYWKAGSGTNQDLGWVSPTGLAAVTTRTLRHALPLQPDAATEEYLDGWRVIDPELVIVERTPTVRDEIAGVRLHLSVAGDSAGRRDRREVIVEVYPRGRFVQTVSVESSVPRLLGALEERVFQTAHLAAPASVTAALAAAGSGPSGLSERAKATADLGDLPGALELYREAMKLNPKDGRVRRSYLSELSDWGRPEATAEALAALADLPDDRALRAQIATIVDTSGDHARALSILDEGLALAPADRTLTRARNRLAPPERSPTPPLPEGAP